MEKSLHRPAWPVLPMPDDEGPLQTNRLARITADLLERAKGSNRSGGDRRGRRPVQLSRLSGSDHRADSVIAAIGIPSTPRAVPRDGRRHSNARLILYPGWAIPPPESSLVRTSSRS